MKLTPQPLLSGRIPHVTTSSKRLISLSIWAMLCLILGTGGLLGAQLIWDPLNNGGNPPAGGNWDITTGNKVWAPGNVAWTQTSTTAPLNGATFGGADGTWAVSLDSGQIAVNNITINNSGYTFSGSPIFMAASDTLSVAAGKTVTINCNITGTANKFIYWALGSGATMNFAGNMVSGTEPHLVGPSDATFTLTGVNAPTQVYILGQVNLTSGSLTTSSAASIGYPDYEAAFTGTQSASGTLTVSGASTVFTANGNFLFLGRTFGSPAVGGQGTLTVNNGTVNVGSAANKNLAICYDGMSGESGTVNMNGGTLNVGSSSINAAISFFQTGEVTGETATLNQTGGTINAWGGIVFGPNAGSGGIATWTQTGGTNYVGQPGVSFGSGSPTTTITSGARPVIISASPIPRKWAMQSNDSQAWWSPSSAIFRMKSKLGSIAYFLSA